MIALRYQTEGKGILEMHNTEIEFYHIRRFDFLKGKKKEELQSWIIDEEKFWTEILHTSKSTNKNSSELFFENISNYVHELNSLKTTKNPKAADAIENFQLSTPLPFHNETPYSEDLLRLTKAGQLSLAIYFFRTSLRASNKNYIDTHRGTLNQIDEMFNVTISNTTDSLKKEINTHIENTKKAIEFSQTQAIQELENEVISAKTKIDNIVNTANKEILSAEPVTYWKEREKNHKKSAKWYLSLIVLFAILFAVAILSLAITVLSHPEKITILEAIEIPNERFGITLLIIATTAAIWLIRVLVRLMMTNLALEIEALERSTMIKTYIAMNNAEKKQADGINMLFYTTLFRPTTNNLTDDSTSPEYIRIIEAMLQKSPPSK